MADEPEMELDPEDRTYGSRVQSRINSLVYERNTERDRAAALAAEKAALEAQLAAREAREATAEANGANAQSNGKGEFSDEDLNSWQGNFLGTVIEATKVALEGRDDAGDLLKQLNSLNPSHYSYVEGLKMQRLAGKAASEPVEALKGELAQNGKAAAFKTQLQNELRKGFGDEVMDMESDLMTRAAQIFKEIAPRFGNDDSNGAITWQAVEAAHREMGEGNRDGRALDNNAHRRLAVEGEARREASRDSNIATLKARAEQGDWRAGLQLGQSKVAKWLEGRAKGMGQPPPNFG